MTLIELMNQVLLETGRSKVTEQDIDNDRLTVDQQMVLSKINNEAQEIMEEWEWAQFKNVAVEKGKLKEGDSLVELEGEENRPPDPFEIYYVAIATEDWETLDQISDHDFDELDDELDIWEKEPDWYRISHVNDSNNPVIEVYPTPPRDYDIRYRYYERYVQMDNSSDIVPSFDRAIKWGAVASVLNYDGEQPNYALQKYSAALNRAKQKNEPNRDIVVGGNYRRNKRDRSEFDFSKPLGE